MTLQLIIRTMTQAIVYALVILISSHLSRQSTLLRGYVINMQIKAGHVHFARAQSYVRNV